MKYLLQKVCTVAILLLVSILGWKFVLSSDIEKNKTDFYDNIPVVKIFDEERMKQVGRFFRGNKIALVFLVLSTAFIFLIADKTSDYRGNQRTILLASAISSTGIQSIESLQYKDSSLMKAKYYTVRYEYSPATLSRQELAGKIERKLADSKVKIYVSHDFKDNFLIQAYNAQFFYDILVFDDRVMVTVNKKDA